MIAIAEPLWCDNDQDFVFTLEILDFACTKPQCFNHTTECEMMQMFYVLNCMTTYNQNCTMFIIRATALNTKAQYWRLFIILQNEETMNNMPKSPHSLYVNVILQIKSQK